MTFSYDKTDNLHLMVLILQGKRKRLIVLSCIAINGWSLVSYKSSSIYPAFTLLALLKAFNLTLKNIFDAPLCTMMRKSFISVLSSGDLPSPADFAAE
jgi:hypothetical protein